MTPERFQCPRCGYLLDRPTALCPVCHPYDELPEHVKHEWAVAHWRGLVLHLAKRDVVVREASLWEEHPLLEDDVRPLLLRMEEDGEIERFAGCYRVRSNPHDADA
jgi:RNA polymerase subunit RPABC4/transcription elongation factor Spt4